jgi:hypothetical protein
MATASDATTLAAGAVATDVLAPKLGFKAGPIRGAVMRAKALAGATGLLMTLYSGSRLIFADRQVPFAATTSFPSWLDHVVASPQVVYPGEALNLSFRNPTAGTITVNWEVEQVP